MKSKIEIFQSSFSGPRMDVFIRFAKNEESAFDLYVLDLNLSESLYVLLHCLELSLRNKINFAAQKFFKNENWFDCVNFSEFQKTQIENAKKKSEKEAIFKKRKNYTCNDVICNLTFGFWVNLFSSEYSDLWKNVLQKIFFNKHLKRKDIHSLLLNINRIRNRVAHYEVIIKNKNVLESRYNEIIEVLSELSPDLCIFEYEKDKCYGLLSKLREYDY